MAKEVLLFIRPIMKFNERAGVSRDINWAWRLSTRSLPLQVLLIRATTLSQILRQTLGADGSIRDKAFKSLRVWLTEQTANLDGKDYLRLWKALFYCKLCPLHTKDPYVPSCRRHVDGG